VTQNAQSATVASLHRLHRARTWALRILVLGVAGAMLAAPPLLLLAPRIGGAGA
jgi:hypothetical protein